MYEDRFVIIKGFIDGRDDKLAGLYGVFLGVASSLEVKYLKAYFSATPIDREQDYAELLSLFQKEGSSHGDDELRNASTRLERFVSATRLLTASAKNMNNKIIEQQVSHFCSEELQLRSVTFVEIKEANETDIAFFSVGEEAEAASEEPSGEDAAEGGEATDADESAESDGKANDVFIALEPVLDPVSGVATTDLAVGDSIVCRLPENSVYFKLFAGIYPDMDGQMAGKITEIKTNEFGTAVVAVHLADGISGMLKLSGSIRMRLAGRGAGKGGNASSLWGGGKNMPFGLIVFGSLGVFLLLIAVLLYFL